MRLCIIPLNRWELFGVTEHTLRFYTDKGLLPCGRDGGNRRVFNEESVN